MRIQYVLHAEFEKPGAIDDWARSNHFTTSTSMPFKDEKLPSPELFDVLILMGGPQTPLKMETYPYLKGEVDLIKQAIDKGKIIIGFCLGAQLIGEAYGAKTEKSPHKEVGVFPIHLTNEGRQDPLFSGLNDRFSVMHWHNDMPGIPQGAKILAYSEGCPRQAVHFGKNVYGFQCHPEAKLENVKEMIENCREDLTPGLFVQTEEELLIQDFSRTNQALRRILDNLVNLKHSAPIVPKSS